MDRKSILALVLIGVVIILWPLYIQMVTPVPSLPLQNSKSDNNFLPKKDSVVGKSITEVKRDSIETKIATAGKKVSEKLEVEKIITIRTGSFTAKISNKGGGTIRYWGLNKYHSVDGKSVNFVKGSHNLNVNLNYQNTNLNLESAFFQASTNDSIIEISKEGKFQISYVLPVDGKQIIQTLTFYGEGYTFDFDVEFKNFGDDVSSGEYYLQWKSGLVGTEKDIVTEQANTQSIAYLGEEKEELDPSEESAEKKFSGTTKWLASRTMYFMVAMIPLDKDGIGCTLSGRNSGSIKENYLSLNMKFEPNRKDRFKFYIGPMDYDNLKELNDNLTVLMEWGWAIIRPISRAILLTFKFLYGIIPNYGWVVIVFALIVKIVLYPLTYKTFTGMRKMKEVMPRQQALQKKFKDNPAKMQQEMMKLYKEAGYNPLSGCLPMLLQMPLLFPIYQIFSQSIDLRQAPFFGWISDLSVPDTIATLHTGLPFIGDFNINPLPIVMTIFTFLQQKIAPMAPMGDASDPAQRFNQKFMMYGMPILFFFLFNNYSSGLVLYWTMFNVFTVAQQLVMEKYIKAK